MPATLYETSPRRRSVISLTPLIDVVFILLVFFMLATSFMDWRMLSLDASSSGQSNDNDREPLIVSVQGTDLLLNGEKTLLEALVQSIQARERAKQVVVVQPLGMTSTQQLVRVLDRLSRAGIDPLTLTDDPQWQPDD